MTIIHWVTLMITILFFLASCQTCDCYGPGQERVVHSRSDSMFSVTEINTGHIGRRILARPPNYFYGFQLMQKENKPLFVYLTTDSKLEITGLADSSLRFSIDVSHLVAGNSYRGMAFSNDSVFIFQPAERKLIILKLEDDFSVREAGKYDIKLRESETHFYYMANAGFSNMVVRYPYVLIPYGNSANENYIESTAYLLYNLQNGEYSKIVRYPDCYKNCDVRGYQGITVLTNGYLYCLFKKSDELFRYDDAGVLVGKGMLVHNCRFEAFDKSRSTDLAYVRKYQVTGESNMQLLEDGRNNLLVLKQSKSATLSSPKEYEVFLFNAQLEQLSSFKIRHPVSPYAAMRYQNGFLIFDANLEKTYHYVVQSH